MDISSLNMNNRNCDYRGVKNGTCKVSVDFYTDFCRISSRINGVGWVHVISAQLLTPW